MRGIVYPAPLSTHDSGRNGILEIRLVVRERESFGHILGTPLNARYDLFKFQLCKSCRYKVLQVEPMSGLEPLTCSLRVSFQCNYKELRETAHGIYKHLIYQWFIKYIRLQIVANH